MSHKSQQHPFATNRITLIVFSVMLRMQESVHQKKWRASTSGGAASSASANRRRLLLCFLLCMLGALGFILLCGAHDYRTSRTRFEPTQEQIDRLHGQNHFFAANFHNNAEVLKQQIPVYMSLFATIGERNVFVSIFENGSNDGTQDLLRFFASELESRNIAHHIVLSKTASWNGDGAVTNATMAQRIAFMAQVRNAAMLPLLQVGIHTQQSNGAATDSLHQISAQEMAERTAMSIADLEKWIDSVAFEILSSVIPPQASGAKVTAALTQSNNPLRAWLVAPARPTSVLFVNDVFFSVSDAMRLLLTRDGDYDMACSMDFDLVKFYDVWVSRDMNGRHLSGFYPFVHDPIAQLDFQNDVPFQVYSCWNGMVAMPARPFLQEGVRFRSWLDGESRSLNVSTTPESKSDESKQKLSTNELAVRQNVFRVGTTCEASECALLSKDLWARRHHKIFINPLVRVFYNAESIFLQKWIVPFFNHFFWSWFNSMGRGQAVDALRTTAPAFVECGNQFSDDTSLWIILVPIGLLLCFLLIPTVVLYRVSKVFLPQLHNLQGRAFASVTPLMPLPSGVRDEKCLICCRQSKPHAT
jgi:hypothetical protein